jgi:maltooligosyltrehalose trehalohydrolase
MDHRGTPQELISAAKYGYLFQGQRYAWQKQDRGTRTRGIPPPAFVNFIENHDQVANSGDGFRLHRKTTPGRFRALSALFLLMPGTPMLFQGQEFFADHKQELAAAVQKGRAAFVSQFPSMASPEMQSVLPAPHNRATFEQCKIDWSDRETNQGQWHMYQELLRLRRTEPAFARQVPGAVDGAVLGPEALVLHFDADREADERLLVVNFGAEVVMGSFAEPLVAPPAGMRWTVQWSSEDPQYGGVGTPPIISDDGWRIPGHAALVLRPAAETDVARSS